MPAPETHIGIDSPAHANLRDCSCPGRWLVVTTPPDKWPAQAQKYKDNRFGDRRTEIVFIGADMVESEVREALDGCLLSQKEFQAHFGGKTGARQRS